MTETLDRPTNGGQLTRTRQSVMGSLADRYQMDPTKLLDTLKATCIKGNATNEQVQAFCIVANRYGLDPFLKEIHAFAGQGGAIVPIVGIDGWSKIANSRPDFDGCDFSFDGTGDEMGCTCTIYVKGRTHPTKVTEFLSECKRNTAPWTQFTRRMLRHKAFMQCVRLAFGLGNIYDEDEARDIIQSIPAEEPKPKGNAGLKQKLKLPPAPPVTQRPVSEGQTFEAEDGTIIEGEKVDTTTGESTPTEQPTKAEPDVSGADTEAPTHEVPPMTREEEMMVGIREAAEASQVPESVLKKGLEGFVKLRTKTNTLAGLAQKDFDVLVKQIAERKGAFV